MTETQPAPTTVHVDDLRDLAGTRIGTSTWHGITQERINRFADATDDHQWIHTDLERAAATSLGSTIAHGYLTLSLVPALLDEVLVVRGARQLINVGANRVRFTAPVPVGSYLRAVVDCEDVHELNGAVQLTLDVTIELKGAERPACVAQILFRYYLDQS